MSSREPFSTDYWYEYLFGANEGDAVSLEDAMREALKKETPEMCSVTMERACNLQCAHCIYPPERSSGALSREVNLPALMLHAVQQLPGNAPRLLHEGRILRPWHVDTLATARRARTDLRIGLIDNGTYVHNIEHFARQEFVLDWLDISLDGPEVVHNAQRRNAMAYQVAMQGIDHARKVTKPSEEGGRVSALFTLTTINHASLQAVAEILFGSLSPLVDQLHISTVSPARPEIEGTEQHDLREFWKQAREVFEAYGHDDHGNQRVFFRLYRHPELKKLAEVVGSQNFLRSFTETARVSPGEVYFSLQGVPFIYAPLSIWPGETFLIDADGVNRTAYSLSHSLASLRRGRSASGEDLSGFNVETLALDFDLPALHRRCVDQWWEFRGKRYLKEELEVFRSLE